MSRPFLPKMLKALADYQKVKDGRFRYRLTEIAHKYGLRPHDISRAAHKHGLTRYQRKPVCPLT